MKKPLHFLAALVLAALFSHCSPPPPSPAPYLIPNPPYPPQQAHSSAVQAPATPGLNDANATAPAAPTGIGEYPLAKPTGKINQVISPYEPYHIIDVTGFGPGQLARDPSNRKIFRIP